MTINPSVSLICVELIHIMDRCFRMSIYFDRHTTYKFTAEPTIEEEINGQEPLSEFGRTLKELGVQLIYAYSPQAKGIVRQAHYKE